MGDVLRERPVSRGDSAKLRGLVNAGCCGELRKKERKNKKKIRRKGSGRDKFWISYSSREIKQETTVTRIWTNEDALRQVSGLATS